MPMPMIRILLKEFFIALMEVEYLETDSAHTAIHRKMFNDRHITFYKKFILQTKTLNDGGISVSGDFCTVA